MDDLIWYNLIVTERRRTDDMLRHEGERYVRQEILVSHHAVGFGGVHALMPVPAGPRGRGRRDRPRWGIFGGFIR